MSESLRHEGSKLLLGAIELHEGDHIEVQHHGVWHTGVVRFERHWQSFYIQLPDVAIWMWEGMPARVDHDHDQVLK